MRSAVVVVDMVRDFVDGVLANPAAKGIVAPIGSLVERARSAAGWTVVYANSAHRPDDVEMRLFPPHALAGTAGAAVVDELRPHPTDVAIDKRFYSAFTETHLEEVLAHRGIGRLVLVGQHTDCCVRHTCYDAFVRRFELIVCPDATTVYEPGSAEPVDERQGRALVDLQTYYGVGLVTAGAVLEASAQTR